MHAQAVTLVKNDARGPKVDAATQGTFQNLRSLKSPVPSGGATKNDAAASFIVAQKLVGSVPENG